MNITKLISRLEPNERVFINRRSNRTLQQHLSSVRSIAHHMEGKKFSVNKICPNMQFRKCGALVTRIN